MKMLSIVLNNTPGRVENDVEFVITVIAEWWRKIYGYTRFYFPTLGFVWLE